MVYVGLPMCFGMPHSMSRHAAKQMPFLGLFLHRFGCCWVIRKGNGCLFLAIEGCVQYARIFFLLKLDILVLFVWHQFAQSRQLRNMLTDSLLSAKDVNHNADISFALQFILGLVEY